MLNVYVIVNNTWNLVYEEAASKLWAKWDNSILNKRRVGSKLVEYETMFMLTV